MLEAVRIAVGLQQHASTVIAVVFSCALLLCVLLAGAAVWHRRRQTSHPKPQGLAKLYAEAAPTPTQPAGGTAVRTISDALVVAWSGSAATVKVGDESSDGDEQQRRRPQQQHRYWYDNHAASGDSISVNNCQLAGGGRQSANSDQYQQIERYDLDAASSLAPSDAEVDRSFRTRHRPWQKHTVVRLQALSAVSLGHGALVRPRQSHVRARVDLVERARALPEAQPTTAAAGGALRRSRQRRAPP